MTLEHKTIGPQPATFDPWRSDSMAGCGHAQLIAEGEA